MLIRNHPEADAELDEAAVLLVTAFDRVDIMIPAEQIVPHKPPMLMITEGKFYDGLDGEIHATVADDCPFVDGDGLLEPVALAEILAQGFAACDGMESLELARRGRDGFLVAIRSFEVEAEVLCGDLLKIVVHKDGDFEGFSMLSGEIWRDDVRIAVGNMRVWVKNA